MTDDRGQMSGPPFPVIYVAVVAAVTFVATEVTNKMMAEVEESDFENVEQTCGLGCGQDAALLLPAVGIVVGIGFLIAVGPVIARVAKTTFGRVRGRKQYSVNTVAWTPPRRWVKRSGPVLRQNGESKAYNRIDTCINCDVEDVRGRTIQFGTERVLFGIVLWQRAVGEFDECATCANADAIEYAHRGRMDDPPTPTQQRSQGGGGS